MTDSKVRRNSERLSGEKARHRLTKASLTTRNEILAIVSHDLRNPIGTAAACAEMILQDDAFQNLSPAVRGWLELIKRNVDAALRLISDLLDMERMGEGRLELNLQSHNIGSLFQETVESHAMEASKKHILITALPADIESEIVCDRDRIVQVLSNLVGNAIKFTPEGGSVTLRARELQDGTQISVQDTGPGIPADQQKYIFEKFAQLDSKDKHGLGLGLHISKMLIDAHHGKIWIQSEPGHGSTFYFSIPN